MMIDFNWLFTLLVAVFIYMTCVFILALARKDNSIVDIAWGMGFLGITFLTFFEDPGINQRQILVAALVFLWSLRLSIFIFVRNRKRGEDFRYAQWREQWGKWVVPRSYVQVFLLQGLILLIIALPIILVNRSQREDLGVLDLVGTGLWLLGFLFESIGDLQLIRFKRNPDNKGSIMQQGLWRYSRHPNYFGEAAMWGGLALIACSVEGGWIALASPILLTFLLLKVSGVPMLEKKYAQNPEYKEYAGRTSVFIPWFPKKGLKDHIQRESVGNIPDR